MSMIVDDRSWGGLGQPGQVRARLGVPWSLICSHVRPLGNFIACCIEVDVAGIYYIHGGDTPGITTSVIAMLPMTVLGWCG